MTNVKIDFSTEKGKIKPLHAVNNGPVYKFTEDQRITNLQHFVDAGIPYARTHDASFYAEYGGEHTVDIHAIFPDFSKDVNDPDSYDFVLTDEYLKVIDFAGIETFYRLGSKIEHWPVKYGTVCPPDFQKWAKICEHIIRHYTEGWNNGFHYNINYWEIWNEPDLAADDPDVVARKTWGGSTAEFFEMFKVSSKHLKKWFPNHKIGGPALTTCHGDYAENFIKYCRENDVPLDFFSWHTYTNDPYQIFELEKYARALLDRYGFTSTESILNEWNYVKGWTGDDWLNSLRTEKSLKGSSFIAGTILLSMNAPLDMLMYYDARPCSMNGMFNTDFVCDRLKGYYPFWMFNKLYQLGNAVQCSSSNKDIIVGAAVNGNEKAVMLTHYNDDKKEAETVKISLNNVNIDGKGSASVSIYTLDDKKDAELVREETINGKDAEIYLDLPIYTTSLVLIKNVTE